METLPRISSCAKSVPSLSRRDADRILLQVTSTLLVDSVVESNGYLCADESLNVFHRWIARLTLLLSTIHVAGRLYINNPIIDFDGVPPPQEPYGYLYAGTVGYFLFFFMVIGAARLMRNRFYQSVLSCPHISAQHSLTHGGRFFIITHVGSFILGLIALSVHRPTLAPWLYAGLVVYFIDRILRTARIVWHHTYNKICEREIPDGESNGFVEAISEDTIRVTVRTTLNWIPGMSCFLARKQID